jgi:hypothetical protein
MHASDAIIPRIKIAKAARRIDALKKAANTDEPELGTTSAPIPVGRNKIANLRGNLLEPLGSIARRAAAVGRMSGLSVTLSCGSCSEQVMMARSRTNRNCSPGTNQTRHSSQKHVQFIPHSEGIGERLRTPKRERRRHS